MLGISKQILRTKTTILGKVCVLLEAIPRLNSVILTRMGEQHDWKFGQKVPRQVPDNHRDCIYKFIYPYKNFCRSNI